jgi:hypothetical protein
MPNSGAKRLNVNTRSDRGYPPLDSATVAVFSAPQQAESSRVQRCSFASGSRVMINLCFFPPKHYVSLLGRKKYLQEL